MPVLTRRRLLSAAAGGLILGAGCDMASLAYFIMPEQPAPAHMKNLGTDRKERDPKVVILTWGGFETRSEFIHADRQLSELLAQHLRRHTEETRQKLTVIPARKVEEFKNANPNWRGMPLAEIGRRFGADHVVYLEIDSMSLYEPGSLNTLLRGRLNLNVSLVDVNRPDDTPMQAPFSCTYPGEAPGALPADNDSTKIQFRQAFLDHCARKLSHNFTNFSPSERRRMD